MEHHAGIDVSLEWSSVCIVDASGKIVREIKVASEPEVLVEFFKNHLGKANGEALLDGGAIVLKEIEARAALENCRALINQINAGLSVEKPFVNVSSAAELLLYLEFAASAPKKSPRERGDEDRLNYRWR